MDYAHGTVDDQQKQIAARKYAFLSQQYINALIASSLLSGSDGKVIYKKVLNTPERNSAKQIVDVIGLNT